jgi:hypothetical protein
MVGMKIEDAPRPWRQSHSFYPTRLWGTLLFMICLGCAGREVVPVAVQPIEKKEPICSDTAKERICLKGILKMGNPQTLVKDPGWCEYLFEIENSDVASFTIHNVKLLINTGRYIDSAATYEEIIKPPDVPAEVAGDIAKDAAGIAIGQLIPFGGFLVKAFSNAASASKAAAQGNARQDFSLRVFKNVELAPGGKIDGSAFFPNIFDARSVNLDLSLGGVFTRIEIPVVEKKNTVPTEAKLD